MRVKSRRPTPRRDSGIIVAGSSRGPRRWPWALALAGAVLVLVAALAYVGLAWPQGSLRVEEVGLPQVQLPRLGGRLVRVSVRREDGATIPFVLRPDGTLWPRRRVVPGTRLIVVAVFGRPGWISWISGRTQTSRLELVAPRARLLTRWPRVKAGAPLRLTFDRPVREVEVTGVRPIRKLRLQRPARAVVIGRLGGAAGSVGIRAVAQTWERLPPPTTVTWFPPGKAAMLLARPRPGSLVGPTTPLRLRFSEPAARVLKGHPPSLEPPAPGRWHTTDAHTLEFVPSGYGFGLNGRVQLKLPARVQIGLARKPSRTITWTTPTASELRLEELLALLQYIPLRWTATRADAARTVSSQLAAAVHPPAGRFTWRFPNTPPPLVALWRPGRFNAVVRGAVMAFENEHDLSVDGIAGRRVWQALIADVIAGTPRAGGYSYVFVHSTVPQSLNLWHDGRILLSSPGNTGVPAAPTQLGTFPVFEHIPVGTMSGTNPDGSHYHDPGIRYISYFNHGEGIHAFNRASFGTPQSLGCVELPLAAAAKVWPYTPIGTLVTVQH